MTFENIIQLDENTTSRASHCTAVPLSISIAEQLLLKGRRS